MKNVIKDNKGFTLTELLATIVILAVVVLIATPAVIGVSNSIKENMYESKVKLIQQAAKLYGEDNETTFFTINNSKCIYVKELCSNNYVTKDDKASNNTECLENPKDGGFLGSKRVLLEKQSSGRIKATYKGDFCP